MEVAAATPAPDPDPLDGTLAGRLELCASTWRADAEFYLGARRRWRLSRGDHLAARAAELRAA